MVSIIPSNTNNSIQSKSLLYIIIIQGWLVGFYGISTFVGYLTPNPFLCK